MSDLLTRAVMFGRADGADIPCTIATTAPVGRGGEFEVLSCAPEDVDLSRAPLPLLIGHDQSRLAVGLIDGIRCTGDKVTGLARFGTSAEAQAIRADVEAGIHRSLSVGYERTGIRATNPESGATEYRWRPVEASIVSVPADASAGFYRNHSAENDMTTTATKTPAAPTPVPAQTPAPADPIQTWKPDQRAEQILELCTRHGMADKALNIIQRSASVEAAKDMIINELAMRDALSGGHHNTRVERPMANDRELILNTLTSRMGGAASGPTLGRASLIDLAERALTAGGQRIAPGEHRDTIFQRAFGAGTTSDFPQLLNTAAARVLAQAMEDQQSPIKAIARKVNRPDFRILNSVRADSAPDLLKVNEHGEYKYGSLAEASNGWGVATFGRILALTRQAIINDDLGAFAAAISGFAASAARLEADRLASMLLTPGTVDGAPVFDATRGTSVDKALTAEGLAAAVLALRGQRGLHGGLLAQQPGTLIVPAALELKALQLVTSLSPARTDDVQPFSGLTVAVEPRLDAASATAWYLVARNQSALEYGYLEGAEGVQMVERGGFEVDGVEYRARLDFGCGWAAPVGWVKSTGTAA